MRTSHLIVCLAVAAGCKGKDNKADNTANEKPKDPATTTGSAPAPAPTPTPAPPPAPAADMGSCELEMTGKLEAKETIPGSNASVMTEHWFGAAEKAEAAKQTGAAGMAVNSMKLLTLNCQGKTISVSIIPGEGASAKTIPFAPKTYKLQDGKGELAMMVTVKGTMVIKPTGTIDITAFDGKHIAATLDLELQTMEKDKLKLTGKLDYPCNNTGCTK